MRKRKLSGRNVHGLLIVDKPAGQSSNQVLQDVKRIYDARKAGHTGTLDPIATGLLVICFGQATKVSQHLLNAAKTYRVTCRLGMVTQTGDREGDVIGREVVTDEHRRCAAEILENFVGEIEQLPPMYSAIKYKGTPLYKLARQGKTVERTPRLVTIHAIQEVEVQGDELTFDVSCSKGTYVRTLVEDMGKALGCGAYVHDLRRLRVGGFDIQNANTLTRLEELKESGSQHLDRLLCPIEQALLSYPELRLSAGLIEIAKKGKRLRLETPPTTEYIRVYDRNGIFCGLGEMEENGRMALRTFASSERPLA